MAHRGGVGFDGKTGDGSGLLFDINKDFYRKIIKSELSISLPEEFAIGSFFAKKNLKDKLQRDLKKIFRSENLKIICFRDVPTDASVLGEEAMDTLPEIFQVFLEQKDNSSYVSLRSSLFQALKTIENLLQPVFFTALTTSIGFAALAVTELVPVRCLLYTSPSPRDKRQ